MKHAPEGRPVSVEVSDAALFASIAAGDLSAPGIPLDVCWTTRLPCVPEAVGDGAMVG